MAMIEINVDLTDINYFLLGKKAFELWEFQKQKDEMCNNCNREDFTSDLIKPELKYNPDDPFWEENKKHTEFMCRKRKGFYFNDIFVMIEDDEDLEEEIEKFKIEIIQEKWSYLQEKIEDRQLKEYWDDVELWKSRGMIFEDQPSYPDDDDDHYMLYSRTECKEFQEECKLSESCNKFDLGECITKECNNYEPRFLLEDDDS